MNGTQSVAQEQDSPAVPGLAFDAEQERAGGESPVQCQEDRVWLGPWPLIPSPHGFPGTGQGSWQSQQVFGEIQRFKGLSGCA